MKPTKKRLLEEIDGRGSEPINDLMVVCGGCEKLICKGDAIQSKHYHEHCCKKCWRGKYGKYVRAVDAELGELHRKKEAELKEIYARYESAHGDSERGMG